MVSCIQAYDTDTVSRVSSLLIAPTPVCTASSYMFIFVPLQFSLTQFYCIPVPPYSTMCTRRCGSVGVSFISFYISSQSYKSIASKRNAMMMMMYGYVKDCTLHNTQYKPYQNTHQCAHRILTTSGISMRIHIVIHSAIKRWTIF